MMPIERTGTTARILAERATCSLSGDQGVDAVSPARNTGSPLSWTLGGTTVWSPIVPSFSRQECGEKNRLKQWGRWSTIDQSLCELSEDSTWALSSWCARSNAGWEV